MRFARPASSIRPQEPLTWVGVISENGMAAIMVCPEGHVIELYSYHINYDGRVSPAVECGRCGFMDEVTLAGWRAAA